MRVFQRPYHFKGKLHQIQKDALLKNWQAEEVEGLLALMDQNMHCKEFEPATFMLERFVLPGM